MAVELKILDGQLARMLTFLSAFDFIIQHRAGRLLTVTVIVCLVGYVLKLTVSTVRR